MPSRRQIMIGTATVLASAVVGTPLLADPTPADEGRLNFVVILADDLGYGEIGAYGQQLISTPALDRLAAEGLLFTNAYAGAPVCAPSRCSLLTGLHGGHVRVRQNPFGKSGALTADDTTFAEPLRAVGYRTALYGKWGFGPDAADQPSHPNKRGFDEFYGYINHRHAHDYYPDRLWHNGTEIDLPENAGEERVTYAPDLFLKRSVDFIKKAKGPFLLCYTPTLPHAPSRYADISAYASEPWTVPNMGHAAQVSIFDSHVDAIVKALRASGKDRDTVIIVTGDNGPHEEGMVDPDLFEAHGPLRGYKRNLYEGGIRVPFLAWCPGRIAPGTTPQLAHFSDLLPTLADLADAPRPRDIDGLSLAELMTTGSGGPVHDRLYWYRNEAVVTRRANREDHGRGLRLAEAVRQSRWKAIRFAPGRDRRAPDDRWEVELYDLDTDPGERRNVAELHPQLVARLVAAMRADWVDNYQRRPFGVRLQAPDRLRRGATYDITVTVANGSAGPWKETSLVLTGPPDWLLRRTAGRAGADLAPGALLTQTWQVTVPRETTATEWRLLAKATGTWAGRTIRFTDERRFAPHPALRERPPSAPDGPPSGPGGSQHGRGGPHFGWEGDHPGPDGTQPGPGESQPAPDGSQPARRGRV